MEVALLAASNSTSLPCLPLPSPQERRSDIAHHPTFRKIYCDTVPYLFKKVRHSLWTLFILATGQFQALGPWDVPFLPRLPPKPIAGEACSPTFPLGCPEIP